MRALAVYLPQFHPIPENDEWWGTGFTEWRNVVRARPLFPGHQQPHLPADLGFYDLRVPETREAQAELAREHGIHGFVYYHYWFNGRRLLERPFDEVLASGAPDFPFALTWANENWSRTWDGAAHQVLMAQEYSEADDRAHIRSLLPAFADPRYIRVDGRPLFLVYHATRLPDSRRTTDIWREEASRAGLGDLYLCRWEHDGRGDPVAIGLRRRSRLPARLRQHRTRLRRDLPSRIIRRLHLTSPGVPDPPDLRLPDRGRPDARPAARGRTSASPCVTPTWDNTPVATQGASSSGTRRRRSTSAGCAPCSTTSLRTAPTRTSSSSTRGTSGPRATTSSPACGGVADTSRPPSARSTAATA